MKTKVWLFLLVFTASFHSFGQHAITGKVIDGEQKGALIGAHVYMLKNWRKGAITDAEGNFSLELTTEEKSDSLVVSFIGFREMLLPVSNDMVIEMQSIEEEGETVVVTAKPLIAEEFKYMEIKKIDIYTNPAAKADPLLAVNSLASSTTADESANISLRGSSPIETGVFLNNVPIYDGIRYSQLNGIGTFSIFNTSIIQKMTVFPGNPPLEFGNATSGIISMETDDGILEGNTNSLILSLASIGFSRDQRINKNQSIKLFSNWQPSGPIKLLNEKALEDIESFTSNDFGVYWYGANEAMQWKVFSYSLTEGYEFNFQHPTYDGIFDQVKRRSFLISTIEMQSGQGSLSLNTGASISSGDYSYSNVSFGVLKKDLFLGINYMIAKQNFSLKTGVSYDFRNSNVDGNYHEHYYALGSDHPTIAIEEKANIKVLEGFGYFKYFFTDRLTLGTGVRKNIPLDEARSYVSNQANVSFAEKAWTITAGIGVYNKLGLLENTGEPFEARNFQKSIDIRWSQSGKECTVSFFDKEGEINSASYRARGMEIFSDYRVSQKLRVSGSLTLLDASSQAEDSYTYDLPYFLRGNSSYSPGRLWTIESTLISREGSLFSIVSDTDFNGSLNAYEPFYADSGRRLPDYMNVGISVSKVFAISDEFNMIAFASLTNVLDRQNIRGFSYNFDYSERNQELFSLRTGYVGAVINF